MTANSKIEWCDHTFNPWIGCQKVSPACLHCYAEKSTPVRVLRAKGVETWGVHAPRHRTSAATWKGMRDWNAAHDAFHALHGRRQRVFCASLADVFDNAVPIAWFTEFLDLCRLTPHLDKLLLTKRIGLVERRLAEALEYASEVMLNPLLANWIVTWLDGEPPPDIWLGTTVVNQPEADRDISKLVKLPARVRFLSMEPLLSGVDILKWLDPWTCADCEFHGSVNDCGPDGCEKCGEKDAFAHGSDTCTSCGADDQAARASCPQCGSHRSFEADSGFIWSSERKLIDWVIVGGESGPCARPMRPDWVRSLRDQCAAAGVPFLFKQWGKWTPGENVIRQSGTVVTAKWFNAEWSLHEEDLAMTDGHIDDEPDLYRVGKKAAGRHLDGRTHDEFPS